MHDDERGDRRWWRVLLAIAVGTVIVIGAKASIDRLALWIGDVPGHSPVHPILSAEQKAEIDGVKKEFEALKDLDLLKDGVPMCVARQAYQEYAKLLDRWVKVDPGLGEWTAQSLSRHKDRAGWLFALHTDSSIFAGEPIICEGATPSQILDEARAAALSNRTDTVDYILADFRPEYFKAVKPEVWKAIAAFRMNPFDENARAEAVSFILSIIENWGYYETLDGLGLSEAEWDNLQGKPKG